MLAEAKSFYENGLEHDPNNEELKKLAKQIDLRRLENEQREAQVSRAVSEAKVCYLHALFKTNASLVP